MLRLRLAITASSATADRQLLSRGTVLWTGSAGRGSTARRFSRRCSTPRKQDFGASLYRYRNDLSPGEGAFGICCFWAAEYLALGGGSLDEAKAELRNVLRYANDLGLFGEEIDPDTGAVLGNFPQGFTHVGLINTALTLAARQAKENQEQAA